MSIICTKVEDSPHTKRGLCRFLREYVWATIDPTTIHQLPFPRDYKYFPCFLSKKYALWSDRIQNFTVRPDDVWVLGHEKTGTTWIQNIVHQLKIKKLDFTVDYIQPCSYHLESPIIFERNDDNEEFAKFVEAREKLFDVLSEAASPRMFKSHLHAYLLPKELWTIQPKIIYTSREVKDVVVSQYHMHRNLMNAYQGTMENFFDATMDGCRVFGPFYEHISSFYQLRHFKNILFLTYEELNTNTFECVKRVSEFLECSYSDDQLRQLIEHVSFGKMREKIGIPSRNSDFKFCRKGKVGGYQDDMSEEYIQRFDEWTAKKKTELNLP